MKASLWVVSMVLASSLAGCANSGVIQVGKDTYTASVRAPFGGPSSAKGTALKEANLYCSKQNKQLLLKDEHSSECMLHGGCGQSEITFMCLDASDPRYSSQH
jgi:hypothetical protein